MDSRFEFVAEHWRFQLVGVLPFARPNKFPSLGTTVGRLLEIFPANKFMDIRKMLKFSKNVIFFWKMLKFSKKCYFFLENAKISKKCENARNFP